MFSHFVYNLISHSPHTHTDIRTRFSDAACNLVYQSVWLIYIFAAAGKARQSKIFTMQSSDKMKRTRAGSSALSHFPDQSVPS